MSGYLIAAAKRLINIAALSVTDIPSIIKSQTIIGRQAIHLPPDFSLVLSLICYLLMGDRNGDSYAPMSTLAPTMRLKTA